MVTPAIEFNLQQTLPLLNVWQRMHWRTKKKFAKNLSKEVMAKLPSGSRTEPMSRCLVFIERYSSATLPDHDGLSACPKALLDSLVMPSKRHPYGLGVILDDNPACVGAVLTSAIVGTGGANVAIYEDTPAAVDLFCEIFRRNIERSRP